MSVWDDLPLGPSLSGLTLKSCVAQARSDPSFACDVRRTIGEDLSVFVEGMRDILVGDNGPTRRLALLCAEHGLGREADWEVIFSKTIRAAAYTNMLPSTHAIDEQSIAHEPRVRAGRYSSSIT